MDKVLLVAIDNSAHSMHAIDYAVELARDTGLSLVLVHVQPRFNTYYANKKIGKKRLQEFKEECAIKVLSQAEDRVDGSIDVKMCWRQGIVAQEICKEAKRVRALGIIMGAKSIKSVKGRLLGSTCYQVIKQAPCPVTIVS